MGSTFQLSQSYLKRSETLMNSLTSLVVLKDKITKIEQLFTNDVRNDQNIIGFS